MRTKSKKKSKLKPKIGHRYHIKAFTCEYEYHILVAAITEDGNVIGDYKAKGENGKYSCLRFNGVFNSVVIVKKLKRL